MNNKDKSFDLKGHQVKPIILELSQEEQNKNQSLIKKMIKQNNNSNIKFSGGYKNNSGTSQIKKQLYRPQSHQQKSSGINNPYQELGISKVQNKYRVIDQDTGNNSNVGYTMQQLQSKVYLLKRDRDDINNHLLQKVDSFNIADNKQRFQNVVHVQSSLDMINLQNIQAKLEAHRRNMKTIEDEYNMKKGKQSSLDRYGYMKVNIDVDKEYAQLEVNEDKIYELVRKRQNLQPQQIQFEDLWEIKKKNDPKLAQYDAKYQQYLVSKDAKNLIGSVVRKNLFTWDRFTQSNHTHHKSKPNHKISHSPSKQNHHSISKQKQTYIQKDLSLNTSKYGPDGLASVKDIKDVIAKKDDKFIASYIFTQIDTQKIGLISKQQFHDYLLTQQHIINGYNIDTKWLFTDLDNFQTKRKGMLTKAQLSIFLVTLQKIQHPKLTLTNKSDITINSFINTNTMQKQSKGIISTFKKYKPIFLKLFNTLDFNDDKIIKRAQYIENIYIDSDCVKILDQQVIKIQHIEKSIKVRQIIGFILDDYQRQKNQKLKKSKEYITFTRFCEYFDIPQSLDLSKIDRVAAKKKQDKSTQYDIYDIPQECLQLLKDIFNQIPRVYQDYTVSADFVQAALRDPQIQAQSDQLCRVSSVQTNLPLQSLGTTLHRMQKQCDQYSTWQSVKLYFSRRGRPLDWDYELILQKKQLRNKKIKQQRQNVSKSKLRQTQNYFKYSDDIKNKSKDKIKRVPDKYTVPQPFDITDLKQKANIKMAKQGQKQFEQLKKQFKAAPVNKQILQPKPQLIEGKVKKEKSVTKKPAYNYQNYENDRIERVLKRAQQQQQKKLKIQQIKQKTQIKALDIGIDLTKKYQDVIKQQQKKKRQTSKYKPTQPKISENLYPADIAQQQKKKLERLKQKMKKQEQAGQRKKNNLQEQKKRAKQKNQKARKATQDAKLNKKQDENNRNKIATDGIDFKPKINKTQLSKAEKEALEKQRQQRQKLKQQDLLKILQKKQEERKKRLGYDKKSVFLPIDGLNDDEIFDKIDQINFEDLLLDEKDKQQYRKEYNNQNKTLKQLKQRQMGLAGRQRAAMQQQQKRLMDKKRLYKQKIQKQKTNPKQNYTKQSAKGQKAAYQSDLNFHKSKALRRYRALMGNKVPDSEFDKYSVRADIQTRKTQKNILPNQQQISQIQRNDQAKSQGQQNKFQEEDEE